MNYFCLGGMSLLLLLVPSALHLHFFVFPAISAITCQSQEINKSIVLLRR